MVEDAFLRARVSYAEETFDIVDNNCSTFVLGMLRLLGVPVTQDLVNYAVVKLMENEEILMPMLEGSPHFGNIKGGMRRMLRVLAKGSSMILVEKLVRMNIEKHFVENWSFIIQKEPR